MGVERLFSSIRENIIIKSDTIKTRTVEHKLDVGIACIDFNSIIHTSSTSVGQGLNKILYKLANNLPFDDKIQSHIDAYKIQDIVANYDIFKKNITDDRIDEIVIHTVEKQVYMIVSEFIEANKLQILQIAIDGVPSKSKAMEQKKRRYLGYMMIGLSNKIYLKHRDNLKNVDPSRVFFIENKISWSKNNISPGTEFMFKISQFLNSESFHRNLKKLCPKLTKIIIDDSFTHGEGEKKIMELLLLMHEKDILNHRIAIYSPDSDMTILCMILKANQINDMHIIRHNQQEDNFDIIDIDKLSNNLVDYINEKTGIKNNKYNVLCDISYLFTIFGNDFVPKVESINVKQDFEDLISIYIKILKEHKYLIDISKPIKKLNMDVLFQLIKLLHINEGTNLQKNYIASHFRNFNKLKEILGANNNNFTHVLNKFLEELRELNESIKQNKEYRPTDNFTDIFAKFVRINGTDVIKEYRDYYKKHKQFMKVKIGFQSYANTINDEYHQNKIKQIHLLDNHMKITNYDKELYQFENALDEYRNKLNFKSLNLGAVKLDHRQYTLHSDKIINDVKKYYREILDTNDINVNHPVMYKFVYAYIEGLIWVFEYYMNGQVGNEYVFNYWYYKYNRAPLLKQIYEFMKLHDLNDLVNNITKELKKYEDSKTYFNCLEHLVYVSPGPTIKILLGTDIKNSESDIDIDKIIDKIWTSSDNNVIDCRGAMFLTKCHLKLHFETTMEQDLQFIDNIRKMKLSNHIKQICKLT